MLQASQQMERHWGRTVGSRRQSISKDARTPTHAVNSRDTGKTDEQWAIGGNETTRQEGVWYCVDWTLSWNTRALPEGQNRGLINGKRGRNLDHCPRNRVLTDSRPRRRPPPKLASSLGGSNLVIMPHLIIKRVHFAPDSYFPPFKAISTS